MRFDREGPECADDMKSLLTAFVDICGMLIKSQFIVNCDAKVFEIVHYLHWFVVNVYVVLWGSFLSGVKYEFFCFCYVEVVVCTPF